MTSIVQASRRPHDTHSVAMTLLESFFGRRETLWFENGAAGARAGKFAAQALVNGKAVAVMGTAVSREGLAFVAGSTFAAKELDLTFTLRQRTIAGRVRVDRSEAMQAPERIVHRYFCSFTAIAADDWDAVVRYVDNVPEPKPVEKRVVADDDFRALPNVVQTAIVQHLVRAGRLAPPAAGMAPLIRLKTGSVREIGAGRIAQDVLIHSRVMGADGTRSHDTRFRVFSNGTVEALG